MEILIENLPEPLKEMAIEEINSRAKNVIPYDKIPHKLHVTSFDWHNSKQGYSFWNIISNNGYQLENIVYNRRRVIYNSITATVLQIRFQHDENTSKQRIAEDRALELDFIIGQLYRRAATLVDISWPAYTRFNEDLQRFVKTPQDLLHFIYPIK
jgi:hypothetical protein